MITSVLTGARRCVVVEGDCVEVMRLMPEASVDAIVTDPPAGIGFMGKEWDDFRRSRNDADVGRDSPHGRLSAHGPEYAHRPREAFVAWLADVMRECLRVAKPGAHALVWALPRTSHWTGTALEQAGWQVRDVITHHFGSGFPKSLDVSKAIDRANGCERPRVAGGCATAGTISTAGLTPGEAISGEAISGEAMQWQGWGTALKPATEFWFLARKPLSGTVAANVTAHGTGALHIDACRVAFASGLRPGTPGATERVVLDSRGRDGEPSADRRYTDAGGTDLAATPGPRGGDARGRWPSNLVLSHSEGCVRVGERRVRSGISGPHSGSTWQVGGLVGGTKGREKGYERGYADADGMEEVEDWRCVKGCVVRLLDEQSGIEAATGQRELRRTITRENRIYGADPRPPGYAGVDRGDAGGASRFFPTFTPDPLDDLTPFRYVPKAARAEREAGCEHLPARSGAEAVEREEGSDGLNSPRAGAGRTRVGVHNVHPT